ncbi:hypothetical protein [Prescottella equi]|uniref:hypothetical protein n=1 Tax=Rhodococcus hoagii TaxID=43767 RepID=UPI001C745B16|nr:hypothetical protein [Prescottella equi]BCN44702.1 hypothetical protein RE9414_29820 [Prescottella equi]
MPNTKSTKKAETTVQTTESLFARLEREAMEDYTPPKPFVIEEANPPIVITAPVETHRVVAISQIYAASQAGDIDPAQFHPLLRAVCGDAYDRVWMEFLADRHYNVAYLFLLELQRWFMPNGASAVTGGGEELPGGSEPS